MTNKTNSLTPEGSLQRLLEGNKRFVEEKTDRGAGWGKDRRLAVVEGQSPFASVLTCADSRVPPEHLFDAGLGELFVCRNAGNIPDEIAIGSLEYAVAHTGCPLLMVLGHSSCGAMSATVEAAINPEIHESPCVDHVVRRLLPSAMVTRHEDQPKKEWINGGARRHVTDACRHILRASPLISEAVDEGLTGLVGGFYDLSSGKVEILVTLDMVNQAVQGRT